MSQLQDVCAALEAIDGDILQMAHELHGKARAYSQAAQRAAAAARGADGEGSAALARTAAALATASKNCAQAASALTGASREGQAYVKRTVGARSGSGGVAGSMAAAALARPGGAAVDAWDQALPGQRGAWEKLQDKYPERTGPTPGTQPDGAWVGGNDSRLTPGQNAEVDRGIARIRETGEKAIIPGVRAVEAEDGSRHLAGFEYRFKGADRLKEKVSDQFQSNPVFTTRQALATIPDAIRFTFQYNETAYSTGARKDIERLQARGFSLVGLRNTWASDQYKGINSRWRDPRSDVRFEVQFHTGASFEAKQLTHKSYERLRSTAKDLEEAELEQFQRSVTSMIPIPPGVSGIEDYPPRGQ